MTETKSSPATLAWAGEPAGSRAIHARLLQVMPGLAGQLRPNATLMECGGDSIDLVELLCAIESDYGVRLTVDEVGALKTVGELMALINARATRRPPPPVP